MNQYDYFYKTDHHWTTEGGFFAYTQIIDKIEPMLSYQFEDYLQDINNYTVTTYPKWHLGSRGQRVGIYYAGIDDFDLILPKFDTNIYQYSSNTEGDYLQQMISMDPLQNEEYTSRYTYDYVLCTLSHWKNNNANNDLKALIICDSMGKAVTGYMALTFSEVAYIDAYAPSATLTQEYLDEYNPDIVIMMQYPGLLASESTFDFGLE